MVSKKKGQNVNVKILITENKMENQNDICLTFVASEQLLDYLAVNMFHHIC